MGEGPAPVRQDQCCVHSQAIRHIRLFSLFTQNRFQLITHFVMTRLI